MSENKYLKIAIFIIIGIVIAIVGYGIYINQASSQHIDKMVQAKYSVLAVDVAEYREIHTVVDNIDITVKAPWKIDVESQIEGVVEEIYIEVGQRVKAGQPLVAIKNNDILAQMAAADASIEEARANLINCEQMVERYSKLVDNDAISKQDYDNAIAARDAARGRLNSSVAQRELMDSQKSKMIITAPQDAEVMNVYCKLGYYVRAGDPMALLANINDLNVGAVLTTTTLERLSPLNRLFILEVQPYLLAYKAYPILEKRNLDDIKLNQFYINFDKVVPDINSDVNYHKVTWNLKNSSGLLEPTSYQNVKIISVELKRVLSVPRKAINNYSNENDPYIYCVNDDNCLVLKSVATGISDEEYVEIIDGIAEGDRVVISENIDLAEGMKVRTKDYEE